MKQYIVIVRSAFDDVPILITTDKAEARRYVNASLTVSEKRRDASATRSDTMDCATGNEILNVEAFPIGPKGLGYCFASHSVED